MIRGQSKVATELENSIAEEGGQERVVTSNPTVAEFMEQMLTELRKIETHLAAMTEEQLAEEDWRGR